jgi:N-methylhydantoinase A/oxoprolinase/acetone carboxylase beta subunit
VSGAELEIGVDIGGTFTDVVLLRDHEQLFHAKVASTPRDLIDGVRRGIEKVLRLAGHRPGEVRRVIHGSTVATNAVLERTGAVTGLLMTAGFEDTLEIGRQKRSRMYDLRLDPETPTFLAPARRRLGIRERIAADGDVLAPLDEADVRRAVAELTGRHRVEAVAVCYLFSFCNPAHERRTREIIEAEFPGIQVSLSSDVDPTFREYERCVVTALDAYLRRVVASYVGRLGGALAAMGVSAELQVMQSRGGIATAEAVLRRPVSLLLSGLAAGVIGGQHAAAVSGIDSVITLDIGGTSCDIAVIREGQPVLASQGQIAGYPLRLQMVDVATIGAGGGSIAWLDPAGGLRVGPRSAGAEPGPACYGRGGRDATVTDASLVLGYLDPVSFAGGELRLDPAAAERAIQGLADRLGLDLVATAAGIHRIVNARMADEIRRVSIRRGHDHRRFALLTLGGAGPVHGGALALELGIPRIVVPETPGVLSAFGLLVASIEHEQATTFARRADRLEARDLEAALSDLDALGAERMRRDGVPLDAVRIQRLADMRYVGQSYELAVDLTAAPGADPIAAAVEAFHARHQTLYGHADRGGRVEFVNLRTVHAFALAPPRPARRPSGGSLADARAGSRPAYFPRIGKFVECPVYARARLPVGAALVGPAIVEQPDTTVVIQDGQAARVHPSGSLVVEVQA